MVKSPQLKMPTLPTNLKTLSNLSPFRINSTDNTELKNLPNSDSAAEVEEEKKKPTNPNAIDVMDMRDHDEMIKQTIKEMETSHTAPQTLFGFTLEKQEDGWFCGRKFEIVNEVRFFAWLLLFCMLLTGFIFFLVVVSTDSVEFSDTTTHKHGTSLIIAGIFSLLACFITVYQCIRHYQHWTHPASQHLVIRILLMVPVYSISAWLSLMFLEYSTYIDFVRSCYEAFVIYSFMILLTVYLGGHAGVVEWMQYKDKIRWVEPFCCFPRCNPDSNFLWYLKYGALQYAIIAPIFSFIAVVCEATNVYGDGEFSVDRGYLYVAIVINTSQLTSLYSLAWLYMVMQKELGPFSPIYKFTVVKAVVFFTWWQGVGLAVLVRLSIITDSGGFSVGQIQVGLQDFVVCIEMFLAACAHKYTFGYETYVDGSLALLMEQRATFIAQQAYKRAVEAARKELEEREAAIAEAKIKEKEYNEKQANKQKLNGHAEVKEEIMVRGIDKEIDAKEAEKIIQMRAKEIIAENRGEAVLFDDAKIAINLPPASSPHRRSSDTSEEKVNSPINPARLHVQEVERSKSRSKSDQRFSEKLMDEVDGVPI